MSLLITVSHHEPGALSPGATDRETVTIKRQREAANKERDGGKYIKREGGEQ